MSPRTSENHRLTSKQEHWSQELALWSRSHEDLLSDLTVEALVRESAKDMASMMEGICPRITESMILRATELMRDPEFDV